MPIWGAGFQTEKGVRHTMEHKTFVVMGLGGVSNKVVARHIFSESRLRATLRCCRFLFLNPKVNLVMVFKVDSALMNLEGLGYEEGK